MHAKTGCISMADDKDKRIGELQDELKRRDDTGQRISFCPRCRPN
jgi:hypothetical protein